jgi:hypothetical protein
VKQNEFFSIGAAKLRLLAEKRHQAEKKSRRAAVRDFHDQ